MKTVKDLLDHCRSAKNWKYVYGMKGAVMTEAKYWQLYNSLNSRNNKPVWDSDINKVGYVCCDCSGLISSLTGILRNSTNYCDTATETVTINQLKANWSKYVGWGIWLPGHIGVVSDTVGYYYAMDGSARNWAHRPLKDQPWTKVIKLKDIDYSVGNVTPPSKTDGTPTLWYNAYANGKWLGDHADKSVIGTDGVAIHCLMAKLVGCSGKVLTRVHVKNGSWLPWVDGYNASDYYNGYAGDGALETDGIQLKLSNVPGYEVVYRVSTIGSSGYLDWVEGTADYAGLYGKAIDKIQIYLKKK